MTITTATDISLEELMDGNATKVIELSVDEWEELQAEDRKRARRSREDKRLRKEQWNETQRTHQR